MIGAGPGCTRQGRANHLAGPARCRWGCWLLAPALLGLLLAFAPSTPARRAGGRFAAATEHQLSTTAAMAQMRAGGNAVDAAVAGALVAGVANPSSSGIGGGGFALVWVAGHQRPYLIDFRETAPQQIDAAALERRPLPARARGKLVGVPGELKGLYQLHRRLGRKPWSEVVKPAIRHAKSGFVVGRHLGSMLKSHRARLRADPGLAAVFFPNGRPAAIGSLVTNLTLAATLEQVAAAGPAALYQGAVAADIVDSARAIGSPLRLADLGGYQCVERRPIHVRWDGYDIYTMPPPSAGGMMLAQVLKVFSKRELSNLGFNSGAYQHLLAEAMRGALADRMRYLGDPHFVRIDLRRLLSDERLKQRRQSITASRTQAIPRFGLEGGGTHHLVTADARGNWVSLTTTVNRVFGTGVASRHSGVVLNDELADFTTRQQVRPFGLHRSPNRPRGGARPVSSMTPTLVVKGGKAVLALGGSGGQAIATNVTQLLLSHLVFGKTPAEAIGARRFYVPTRSASIWLEPGAPKSLLADLQARGETVGTTPFTKSAVQMIALRGSHKLAAADHRKHGSAQSR